MSENSKDENAIETSYSKGESFEKYFGEFLKKELDWENVTYRVQVKAKNNSKGYQIDIVTQKQNEKGEQLRLIGIIYLILCGICIAVGLIMLFTMDDPGWSLGMLAGGILLEIAGGIFLSISKRINKINGWVECKNRKTKVDIKQIITSMNEFNEYKLSGDKDYRFITHYFVTSSGYVENALKLAEDNGIICYQFKDGKFQIAPRWQ